LQLKRGKPCGYWGRAWSPRWHSTPSPQSDT